MDEDSEQDAERSISEEEDDGPINPKGNKPVDRTDIKTRAQRNRDRLKKTLKRMRNEDRFNQAQEKDLERLDTIIKNNEADDNRLAKLLKKKRRE